jgi:AcrR family transcriptional regulator
MSILREQPRSPKSRPYRMRKRAEQVDQTRLRITEAAVRLHTTIGPANASLSAIAEEAGVTRLTLYRHFPTVDELFAACRAHWRSQADPPNPQAWRSIPDFGERLRTALREQYDWYGAHGDKLYPIYRDNAMMPASTREAMAMQEAGQVAAVLDDRSPGAAQPRVAAAVGHVLSFWTWRSLVVDRGLSVDDAVDLAIALVNAA